MAEYLGTEAHLAARLQFYHAGVELHIAFLNIRGKDMLIVLDRFKSDTVCHCWDDAELLLCSMIYVPHIWKGSMKSVAIIMGNVQLIYLTFLALSFLMKNV